MLLKPVIQVFCLFLELHSHHYCCHDDIILSLR